MKKAFKISIAVVVPIIVLIGVLIGLLVYMSTPTRGKTIGMYESPQQALLVIDIQEDFTGTTARPPFPYRDSAKLIETVNGLIETASASQVPVVYIRQELDSFLGKLLSRMLAGGIAIRGNPGTRIDKRINMVSDHVFPKPISDAFSNKQLESYLIENRISRLVLVGLDADGCVHATARGALNRGYEVVIITDAVVLMKEEKWEQLLKQYREEGIVLISASEFLNVNP
ncbi:cysteine hydrolase [bacterium]|nr:cysteine hydrolase [bacterium]